MFSCSNLDEFFEVRVAGLKQRAEIGAGSAGPGDLKPQQLLNEIRYRVHDLVTKQYEMLNEVLLPALAETRIHFLQRHEWDDEQRMWVNAFYQEKVLPVLTPLTLDPSRPFDDLLVLVGEFLHTENRDDVP